MKKFSLIFLSVFIFNGCGDSSPGKSATTRSKRTLENSRYGYDRSDCNSFDCSLNRKNSFAGNSTETPFSVGQTLGFTDDIQLGLEFYAQNRSSVTARGQMDVLSTANFNSDYCRLPRGLYNLRTIDPGAIGTNGVVNANHEYSGIVLEGTGPTRMRAVLHHALSVNLGDDWALSAKLEILNINGRSCNNYGKILYSFSFQTR